MEINSLLIKYPNINDSLLKKIIKYEDKFSFTIENLSCSNPNCKNIKKWHNSILGFAPTCGNDLCKKLNYINAAKKGKETYFQKTGYNKPSQNPEVKAKTKNTYFQKTGYLNPAQNPECKTKAKENNLKKYGVEYTSQIPETRQKAKNTNLKKYNTSHQKNSHILNYDKWYDREFWIKTFINNEYFDNEACMSFFNCTKDTVNLKIIELEIFRKKVKGQSKAEKEIIEFIKTIYPDIILIQNTKEIINPLELDIYIPEYKIAIEFNGIYWHSYCPNNAISEKQNNLNFCKNRHLIKTKECQKQGIKLFHIFENEWLDSIKQNIWKSVISNALGKSKKLGARKCSIQIVPKKDIRPFLEQNHLQGYGNSPIAYGLYYNNELVSIMTFVKNENKNSVWKLNRFCNKIDYNVQGAASRLLKVFQKQYTGSIISYANRRWSNGNLYRQIGFKEIGISIPNYFYCDLNKSINLLYSRQTFQKHKLENKLVRFDINKTELENCIDNNYSIIWDSGNIIFKKE
jgi:hypothetical protein